NSSLLNEAVRPGASRPSTTPATMQRKTQSVRYRSKTPRRLAGIDWLMLEFEIVSVSGGEPLSALTAADFLHIHFQDRFEPFGVGDRFVGLSQRPPGPIQRFTNHDGRRFVRQAVINPTFCLARGNQSALMKDGKVLGHGGGR